MNKCSSLVRVFVLTAAFIMAAAAITLIGQESNSYAKAKSKMALAGSSGPATVSDDSYESDSDGFVDVNSGSQIVINPGEQKHCVIDEEGENVTYKFTAPKTATYFFYSDDGSDGQSVDPQCRIVANGHQLGFNDDGYEEDKYQFRMILNATAGNTYYLQVRLINSNDTGEFTVHLQEDVYTASIDVSLNKSTGIATVTGTASGDQFDNLYVDGDDCYASISGETSFSVSLDMKDYSVGYHKIYATLKNHTGEENYIYYSGDVPTYVYDKPDIKLDNFRTGPKYFTYSAGYAPSNYDIYLEYRKGSGGSWNRIGPISSYGTEKKGGLKAATKYQVRVFYGREVSYNGKNVLISGKDNGNVSKTFTIKTGGNKPAVKSIKISKVKQSSYVYNQPIYRSMFIGTTFYSYIAGYRKVRAYKTKFKVTVTLKKKPNAAGIYLDGKKLRGNKKKYTTSFEMYGKMKGKKYLFKVYSYQSKTYEGYSKLFKKKVKIK